MKMNDECMLLNDEFQNNFTKYHSGFKLKTSAIAANDQGLVPRRTSNLVDASLPCSFD